MRGRSIIVAATCLAGLAPAAALAQETPGNLARATPAPLRLTLADALSRGLTNNIAAVLARQGVESAEGARMAALSGLLPTVMGRVSETKQKVNLEAFGFPIPAGTNPIVGPFNVFDARVSVSQSVFDLTSFEAARAGSQTLASAQASNADARDTVVLVCANLYLRTVIGAGLVDAVRAQLETAERLHERALNLKAAGMIPGIDVLRAEFQLQAQKQRLLVVENDVAKQKLALARAIGLPLGQAFELVDATPYAALAQRPIDDLLAEAYRRRSDLQAATARLQAAEAGRRAVLGEALPSVRFSADYGDIGNTVGSSKATYAAGIQVRVPLFQGGRVRGRLQQADAGLAAERARLDNLRSQVEYSVRAAHLDVTSASDRVTVARRGVDLANQQLVQAQDRFSAGVTSNLEVVQAQEAVAAATDSHLAALYAHNLAKLSLARALGVAAESAGDFLGGLR